MAELSDGRTRGGESGHRHNQKRRRQGWTRKNRSYVRIFARPVLAGPPESSEPETPVNVGLAVGSPFVDMDYPEISQDKVSMEIWGLWNDHREKQRVSFSTQSYSLQSIESSESLSSEDQLDVVLESLGRSEQEQLHAHISDRASCDPVTDTFLSARIRISEIGRLAQHDSLLRMHMKKEFLPQLDRAIPMCGLPLSFPTNQPQVRETGKGVVIGVIDTGFDLSHPMFRDAKDRLRVKALWDQKKNIDYTQSALEKLLKTGSIPGSDDDGHGTHVASIAGGSLYENLQGVAPNAEFVLVKTNMIDIDRGVKWIFQQAGDAPCVVNVSLSHHSGAHDGTDVTERQFRQLVRPGKIIVTAAGNDRESHLHVGGGFSTGDIRSVGFDVIETLSPRFRPILSGWYAPTDEFALAVEYPEGETKFPALDADPVQHGIPRGIPGAKILLSCGICRDNGLVQVQMQLASAPGVLDPKMLQGWVLRVECRKAVSGRFDMWFRNRGVGRFESSPFVDESMTVGVPSTSVSVLSVGSCISKQQWQADNGIQSDGQAFPGSMSLFSNQGPTRDGRNKPDLCAPGQYITAALAKGSAYERLNTRSWTAKRLLTLEGTSMACPIVTGSVALMLEKKSTLTTAEIQAIFSQCSRPLLNSQGSWHPASGYGVIDIAAALAMVP